jgi:hypothetical protein
LANQAHRSGHSELALAITVVHTQLEAQRKELAREKNLIVNSAEKTPSGKRTDNTVYDRARRKSSVVRSRKPGFVQSPQANKAQVDRIRGRPPVTEAEQHHAIEQLLRYPRRVSVLPITVEGLAEEARSQIMLSLTPDDHKSASSAAGRAEQRRVAAQRFRALGYDQLTPAEFASLRLWIALDYDSMKDAVTNPFALTKRFSQAGAGDGNAARVVSRGASVLESALAKLPRVQGTFYKGIELNSAEMAKFVPGAKIKLMPFTAASAVKPLSVFNLRNAQFVIKVGAGEISKPEMRSPLSAAQDIEHTSVRDGGTGAKSLIHVNPNEAEVMFSPGARFEVLSVTPTTNHKGQPLTIIELEYVR